MEHVYLYRLHYRSISLSCRTIRTEFIILLILRLTSLVISINPVVAVVFPSVQSIKDGKQQQGQFGRDYRIVCADFQQRYRSIAFQRLEEIEQFALEPFNRE